MEIESIEIRHASEPIARRVRAWFESGRRIGAPDGSRSVHLPHPEKRGCTMKIKGAGLRGGPIRFGQFLRSDTPSPVFDFEGRRMEDVAAAHDNAYLGGASFQQAATEFKVSQMLGTLGIPVVPCLGYGRVQTAEHVSWFSIFEWQHGWKTVEPSSAALAEYLEANVRIGELFVRLAVDHDLIGYCWWAGTPDGSYLVKDLHPFRQADPVNMSRLSWVMQVLFAFYIRCQACISFSRAAKIEDLPSDLGAHPLRSFVPDATGTDYEDFVSSIVEPYMLRCLDNFSPRDLLTALSNDRVGRAMLELCPARYAPW